MKQIQLQGIGRKNAIKAEDLEVGMHIVYNYGHIATILRIVPCGTQMVSVHTEDEKGKIWNRRFSRERLVATTEANETDNIQ